MSEEINFGAAGEVSQMIDEFVAKRVEQATMELNDRRVWLTRELERSRAEVDRLEAVLRRWATSQGVVEEMAEVWDLGARAGLEHNEWGPHYNAAAVDWAFGPVSRRNPYRDPPARSRWAVTEDEFAVWCLGPVGRDDIATHEATFELAMEYAAARAQQHPDVIFWVMRRVATEWELVDVQ